MGCVKKFCSSESAKNIFFVHIVFFAPLSVASWKKSGKICNFKILSLKSIYAKFK